MKGANMEPLVPEKTNDRIEVAVEVTACSLQSKAEEIARAFRRELARLEGEERAWSVSTVGCRGLCFKAPLVAVKIPQGRETVYQNVKPMDVSRIVREHIIGGKPVEHLAMEKRYRPFFADQERRVLRNCGSIDPGCIEAYRKNRGYRGLERVVTRMKPEDVITEIRDAGLRNRDSGARSTGELLADYGKKVLHPKNLFCRGEGESSEACITITLMEGDPFSIIEGMTIAAYCIPGVDRGYISYKKGRQPHAVTSMENAIKQAREKGCLGERIMGMPFTFDLELKGAEEGLPAPAAHALCKECAHRLGVEMDSCARDAGLYTTDPDAAHRHDNTFNAETLATLPLIMTHGSSWFRSVGTAESAGTKIFSLVGNVEQAGLVEVAFGTSLSRILTVLNNDHAAVKAFMMGGVGSGFIPRDFINMPLTHSALEALGNRIGSGRIMIVDHQHSIVDMTRYAVQKEISGCHERSLPCVKLLQTVSDLLSAADGGLSETQLGLLQRTAETLGQKALCDYVKDSPAVVLSGLKYFPEEFTTAIPRRH